MKRVLKETTLFRKRFCISQEDLAAYLGISYSALAMYERDERPLATKALIKFAELYTAYETAEKSAGLVRPLPALQEKLDKQHDEAIKKMQYNIIDHGLRISRLQYQLKKITGKHEGAADRLQLFNEVLAALPKTEASKLNRQALEVMQMTACQGLLKAHEKKLKMQLSIALLEAEVGVYEAQVVKLKEEGGL
jgi:transcriptional regulator with XRE-family HTH domain